MSVLNKLTSFFFPNKLRNYRHVLSSIFKNPSLFLIYLSARAGAPRVCAIIALFSIRRVKYNKENVNVSVPIFVLNKSIFIEDVESISLHIPGVELCLFGRTHLHFIAKAFFKRETNDNNYHETTNDTIVQNYRSFLNVFWRSLNSKINARCALSGNFSYFEERELAYVLEKAGVPFVVIHKECLKTPGRLQEYEGLYRSNKGPFWGRKILVYNNIEKDLICRTGVAAEEKITVVGMPRLDAMHECRLDFHSNALDEKEVLLVSFHKDLNVLQNVKNVEVPKLNDIWESVHLCMFEMAKEMPNVTFTIKTKGHKNDLNWLNELAAKHRLDLQKPNIHIVHGGEIKSYIMKSNVVIGVHSTALLEALAANKPVLIPNYNELAESDNDKHFIDFGSAVRRVSSERELRDVLTQEISFNSSEREFSKEVKSILSYWLGNCDGKSSKRAADEIMKIIAER